MAGHSKWANIQHRKGRQDAKRGKIFTRLIKEIAAAAKMGGGDIKMNPRLRLVVDKAKAESMPKENIESAIRRGTGQLDGVDYVECRYEGYGIGGVAVMVRCLTDNKTRTVADVRHAFSKNSGNLGADGCVAFQFRHCGCLLFSADVEQDALLEVALGSGAEDVAVNSDGSIEVITDPYNFLDVKDTLEAQGFKAEMGTVTMKPYNETELSRDDATRMQKLLDALEDLEDVQEVYTSAVLRE